MGQLCSCTAFDIKSAAHTLFYYQRIFVCLYVCLSIYTYGCPIHTWVCLFVCLFIRLPNSHIGEFGKFISLKIHSITPLPMAEITIKSTASLSPSPSMVPRPTMFFRKATGCIYKQIYKQINMAMQYQYCNIVSALLSPKGGFSKGNWAFFLLPL